MRQFTGLAFGGIEILSETVHSTADGPRFPVLDSDLHDAVAEYAKSLAVLGDHLYVLMLKLNHWFNHVRANLGFPYWSLSQYLKHKTKNAVNFVTAFEVAVARVARKRGFHGVVCEHIHKAQVNGVVTALGQVGDGLRNLDHQVPLITPRQFRSITGPTYPEIRLSPFPSSGVKHRIEMYRPDAIHIATEDPLGMAAPRYCVGNDLDFATSFNIRFAEYVYSRIRVPVNLTYRWSRNCHAPAGAVMVPTPALRRDLEGRGFSNTVHWTRGVDTDTFVPGDRGTQQ